MEPKGSGRRELTELVTDHRLRDVHGHVLATVVHRDGVAEAPKITETAASDDTSEASDEPAVDADDEEEETK